MAGRVPQRDPEPDPLGMSLPILQKLVEQDSPPSPGRTVPPPTAEPAAGRASREASPKHRIQLSGGPRNELGQDAPSSSQEHRRDLPTVHPHGRTLLPHRRQRQRQQRRRTSDRLPDRQPRNSQRCRLAATPAARTPRRTAFAPTEGARGRPLRRLRPADHLHRGIRSACMGALSTLRRASAQN